MTNGSTQWRSESESKEPTSPNTWPVSRPNCHVSRCNKHEMVPSNTKAIHLVVFYYFVYYFEVIVVNGVVVLVIMMMNGWGVLQQLFVSFTKGPGGFPCVFIITCEVPTLIPIDGITLRDHGVFVLRGDQKVFDGTATFEVSLDTI